MKTDEVIIGQRYLSIWEDENLVFIAKKIGENRLDIVGEIKYCTNPGGLSKTKWAAGVSTIFFIENMRPITEPIEILKEML